ncbi:MAG: hypothetical protein M1587_06845 [Thaumarchaeota archaeon]|nr:hypothetical protein [Nitrososphaerota archaeon]
MESRIVVVGVIVMILAGVIIALSSVPSSAFTGGQSVTVCTLDLSISGTYTDLIVTHTVSDLALSGGGTGCHAQTLLDLIPGSSLNIFPLGLTFSIVLTAMDGTTHGPYQIQVVIPAGAAAPSYPFNMETSVSNVPEGTYTASVTCPVACTGAGSTSYTTTITV